MSKAKPQSISCGRLTPGPRASFCQLSISRSRQNAAAMSGIYIGIFLHYYLAEYEHITRPTIWSK